MEDKFKDLILAVLTSAHGGRETLVDVDIQEKEYNQGSGLRVTRRYSFDGYSVEDNVNYESNSEFREKSVNNCREMLSNLVSGFFNVKYKSPKNNKGHVFEVNASKELLFHKKEREKKLKAKYLF